MGWLLGATHRLRVGVSVLILPYRNPVVTAKQIATLDALSGGRVIVGAGVGWWPEEFEALAAPPFAERGAVTDEYLRLMKALWTEDAPRFEGKHYRIADVTMLPKPAQKPHPPIWIGGQTARAIRRTAELADAWHPIGLRGGTGLAPEEMAAKVQELRLATIRAGRDPQAVGVAFRAPHDLWSPRGPIPKGADPALPLSGPRPGGRGRPRLPGAGVRTFVFDFAQQDPRVMVETMRRFAREVRPRWRGPPSGPGPMMASPAASAESPAFAADSRVARLATVDHAGHPHVVPICYATDGRAYYSAIDAKPKRTPPDRLRRVRNIHANPHVALLIDHYEEDWTRLRYLLVQGRAELLREGPEWEAARGMLTAKYPQYRNMPLGDGSLLIKITPDRVVGWSGSA
jgi:PPOX class probable F420-dependent enzyme